MWSLINVYLILFLVDGIMSLVDVAARQLLGVGWFSIPRAIVALPPFLLSFPLYVILGSVAGFPKRIILPMVLFLFWVNLFYALPLSIYVGQQDMDRWLTIVQSGLALGILLYLHRTTARRTWFYRPEDVKALVFRWRRLLVFLGAHVIFLPPLLAGYLVACASAATVHWSHGFIHFDGHGITVEARTYTQGAHRIYLLPTFHMAEAAYYRHLIKDLPTTNTVIIPEGVTDKQALLRHNMNRVKLAQQIGLQAQDNTMLIAQAEVKTCDADTSDFTPQTIHILNICGRVMELWTSGNRFNRFIALKQLLFNPGEDVESVWADLIERRNHRVTSCIRLCLRHYDHIVVPWGAGHMPGIEHEILQRGATVADRRRIRVLSWRSLFTKG